MKVTIKKVLSATVSLCILFATISCLSASMFLGGLNVSAAGTLAHSTEIGNIVAGQQAVFNAEVNYTGSGEVELKFGSQQLFHIKDTALTVGTKLTGGSYGKGTYKIQSVISPEQFILTIKVTLPDGGIITRGFPELLGGTEMNFYITGDSKVLKTSVHSEDYAYNSYAVTDSIPYPEDEIGNKIYNIVTSFNEASTTRNFAWTAATSFLGESSMQLKYRKVGTANWTFVDAVKEVERVETVNEDYFKCDITGLTPNTEYEYKIGKKGGAEKTEWTSSINFKTAAKEIDEFTFVAVGDTQGNDNWYYHKFNMAAYEEAFSEVQNPAFILHTGDVVEHGTNQSHWNLFFKTLKNYGASTPFFVAVGNHDAWGVTNLDVYSFYFRYHFNHPNNGGSAALDKSYESQVLEVNSKQFFGENGDETFYSFDYGNAHFVVLNTGSYNDRLSKHRGLVLAAQRDWLVKDLEANKNAKWTIVMMHANAYHFSGVENSCNHLNDVFEDYGVDLVMQGHSHLVSRTYPMKDGKIVTKAVDDKITKGIGTVYTTIGAAKPDHTSFTSYTKCDETTSLLVAPTNTQPTYTTVSINDSKILVTTKQINGFVVDTFTIRDNSVPDIPFKNVTTNEKPSSEDTSGDDTSDISSEDNSSNDTTSIDTESDNLSSENTVVNNTESDNTDSSLANNSAPSDNPAKDNAKINPLLWLLLLIPIAGAAVLVFFLIKKKQKNSGHI